MLRNMKLRNIRRGQTPLYLYINCLILQKWVGIVRNKVLLLVFFLDWVDMLRNKVKSPGF